MQVVLHLRALRILTPGQGNWPRRKKTSGEDTNMFSKIMKSSVVSVVSRLALILFVVPEGNLAIPGANSRHFGRVHCEKSLCFPILFCTFLCIVFGVALAALR